MPTIQFYGKRRIAGAEIVICHPPICRHIGLLPLAGILPSKLLYKVNCLSILNLKDAFNQDKTSYFQFDRTLTEKYKREEKFEHYDS